jgi:hypothetical protein
VGVEVAQAQVEVLLMVVDTITVEMIWVVVIIHVIIKGNLNGISYEIGMESSK